MNDILKNTHKEKNIHLLRVRDYYFNMAKKMDFWTLRGSFVPFILTMLVIIAGYDDEKFDIFLGVLSIVFWGIELVLRQIIDKKCEYSNSFREKYDIEVFEHLKKNDFVNENYDFYDEKYLCNARKVHFSNKYEIWYEEVFSEPNSDSEKLVCELANTICCQADNLIYGAHVYDKTSEYNRNKVLFLLLGSLVFAIIYGIITKDISKDILIIVSLYGSISIIFDKWKTAKDAGTQNKELIKLIRSDTIKNRIMSGDVSVLRELQDKIAESRKNAVFVPNTIRNKYLGENENPFYIELDEIKNFYYKDMKVKKPSNANEIETFDLDGNETGTLCKLQKYLLEMLNDIVKVWEAEGIHYVLDGGTLLGAIREKGKFIFWDDDIDIAIPYEEVYRAKDVIRKKLNLKYTIQDYEEEYYSPRLSNFRIRDLNSIITEKDSYISDRYESKGIFIDIYAYSPILISKKLDAFFRRCFIQPLHRKLCGIEYKLYKYGHETANGIKADFKFEKYKHSYLQRVSFYLDHAHNKKYRCYTPNYLNFIEKYPYKPSENKMHVNCPILNKTRKKVKKWFGMKKSDFINRFWFFRTPQPYIKAECLWGENYELKNSKVHFGIEYGNEKITYFIPHKPDAVLTHCYGNYMKSPFVPLEKLHRPEDDYYLFNESNPISSMKHVKTIKYL